MLAIFPSGATTVGRRGPVRLRARTATGLKGSDCAGMPFAIVLLNPPRPMAFCGPQPTETRTHHADKCSSILVSHPRDHKCSVVNPNMLGQLHAGASIRVVPCDPFLQDHGELLRLLLIGLRIESAVHGVHVW